MADNINVVVETGRLTKAAELKYGRLPELQKELLA